MTTFTDLASQLAVGDPDVAGALAVFPLFGPDPRLDYVSHAEGAARGVTVHEHDRASVNDLLVHNPLDIGVLLYEGEELLGGQQNRTVDAAVLIPAGEKLSVPVSCVEAGRWDSSAHQNRMAPSPQAAAPGLRAAKARVMRGRLAAGLDARADQGEVWNIVGAGAMSDTYDDRRSQLDDLVKPLRRRDGQTGALVALSGVFTVLDHVSRPDVFAALFAPLVQGYALDGLEARTSDPPSRNDAEAWLASLAAAPVTLADTVGAGRRAHFTTTRYGGTGLVADRELIQLSVYAEEAQEGPRTRIRRPSRRR